MAPIVVVGNVHPNLLVVAVVLVTVLNGFGPGVAWAFIGGLTANLLVRDPLGSLPLELLLVAARGRWRAPLRATLVGIPAGSRRPAQILVEVMSLLILQLVDEPLGGGWPLDRIVAAALLNAAIAAIVILPTRILLACRRRREAAW